MSFKNIKKNRGFTLVEMLVAISILSLSILSTFTAVQSGLSKSSFAKDQVTAYYLIQEPIEYIRNLRDQNQLKTINGTPTNWLAGIANGVLDPCYSMGYCYVDSPANKISACAATNDFNSCPVLKQDSNGFFGYISGTNTKFKRAIQVQILNNVEAIVIVRVDWTSGTINKSIIVREWLYNIR